MLSSLIASAIVTVQAQEQPIILWAVVTSDPYWGGWGGYHDILYEIMEEFAKLSPRIDLKIDMYDSYTVWDIVWDEKWNVSGDPDGNGIRDGWDLNAGHWWLMPTGYLWLDCLVYSSMTPPQGGYNIMPWMNERADQLYHSAMTEIDPVKHKQHMWDWQELFMHDPPAIVMYYPEVMTAEAAYIEGWDPIAWFYDIRQMSVNTAVFDAVATPARKAVGSDTLLFGLIDPIYSWNCLYMYTSSEELVATTTLDTLYILSREQLNPPSGRYLTRPDIAAADPIWMNGPNGPNTIARVPIRQDITWTDGVHLNATDVAFSYNLVIDRLAGSWAYADFAPILEEAVVVDEYTVDFVLYEPRCDFTTLFASDWGVAILPWHQLKDLSAAEVQSHLNSITDPRPVSRGGEGLEGTGPYVIASQTPDIQVTLEKRTDYWGHEYGWGTELPDTLMLRFVEDAATRLTSLKNLEIDFAELTMAAVETWEAMATDPKFNVHSYIYPAFQPPLWLNLDSPFLSNRYVRQAMAHALPYEKVATEILPSWGIPTTYAGKTFITPLHEALNTELEPYEHNITVAQMYMNMWRYSLEGTDYTLGPVGDADFSGVVRLDDFIAWATNFGTEPEDWTFLPGNDIDPDFDNSGTVNLDDFIEWAANYGTYYPFEGAR